MFYYDYNNITLLHYIITLHCYIALLHYIFSLHYFIILQYYITTLHYIITLLLYIALSQLLALSRRCLRAEEHLMALAYQKRYLLLLIGGFQDNEQETLAAIARLGVYAAPAVRIHSYRRPTPLNRFRKAVQTVIAVIRFVNSSFEHLLLMMVLCPKAGSLTFTPPGDEMSEVVSRCLYHR